jgi:hypothetical protein
VDGSNTQVEAVSAESASRGVTVTIVIHVLEYPWRASWSFFGKGEPTAKEWVADQARKIPARQGRQIAAGVRRRATGFNCPPAERAGADECARYLTAKARYLDYATALRKAGPDITGTTTSARRRERIHRARCRDNSRQLRPRSVTSSPQKSRTKCE